MFDSLKKKLAGWLGKPTKEKKKPAKAKKEKKTKTPKVIKSKKDKSKKEKTKEIKKEDIKEIEVPTKFDSSSLGYKPDTEKIKEIETKLEEEQKIEEKTEEIEAKPSFFSRLFNKVSKTTIKQEQFDEIFEDLEIILLENNVALEVVDKIREDLSKSLIGKEIKKEDAEKTITNALKESILNVLIEPDDLIKKIKSHQGPFIIIFFGINGTGKTTSIAKFAHLLQKNNISVVLGAADTFRAASIEQLEKHANNLKVPIVKHTYGSDPAAVAFDIKKYAQTNNIKVGLIDTAGRMYTKANLMKEMEKVIRVSQPNMKIFVGEAITGNDAIEQAKIFAETIGIDGIILSKADVDEKAGTILSVSYITKKPIYYLGVGQTYNDLKPFTKDTVLKNLGLE